VSTSLYHVQPTVVESSNQTLLALTSIANGGQQEGKTTPGFTNKAACSTTEGPRSKVV